MPPKKKLAAKAVATPEVVKEVTPVAETPAVPVAPFEGGIAPELPKEDLKVDKVETEKDVLPLQDKVLVTDEDLPKKDEVTIGAASESSPYDEDIEVITEPEPLPKTESKKEWVSDPSLLKKTEGFKDRLSGTVYYGVRK